jgi:hypothetical protein
MFNTRERERERERGALESEEDLRIRKECVWAFCNVIHGGDDLQIKFLVDNGCLLPLFRFLKCDDLGRLKHGVRLRKWVFPPDMHVKTETPLYLWSRCVGVWIKL